MSKNRDDLKEPYDRAITEEDFDFAVIAAEEAQAVEAMSIEQVHASLEMDGYNLDEIKQQAKEIAKAMKSGGKIKRIKMSHKIPELH